MTQTASSGIDELRTAIDGTVIAPHDAGYDDARQVWNADIDRRPGVVAQCVSAEDVRAAVLFGVRNGLEIAVRGGAHSMYGASTVDEGLMIDLSRMNQVTVDPETKRAWVGGGALLGELDAAAQAHGLATPAGTVSHTGVAGLTLGGGMGWLTRQFGLSLDNVLSVQVVTADGRILRAAADENPDLYWAVRGGGGNFGVVTEFEFRLHEVGPMVQYGMLFWGLDQAAEMLRTARRLLPTLPPDTNILIAAISAPPAPFVPEQYHFQPGLALNVVGFGGPERHEEVLASIREAAPAPLFEFVTPMPYTALQQMIDEPNGWGHYCYDKGSYFEELTDELDQVIVEQVARKTSPLSSVLIFRLDNAYSAVGDDDTAFSGGRSPRYAMFIIAVCPVPEMLAGERAWVRSFWDALQPHTLGIGSYVNAMSENEFDRVKASYGEEKYARLARIKAEYDPDNVFRRNANIVPAQPVEATA
ncbi:FAD-binding oxidoreductase [Kribbella sancticallisti]|uniref:FAD-binding oxidoreductase n=1 Tax=Kribbella sancticallisti TaxID=460087 RepID=A0ABP4PZ95_9ACTN